MALPQPDVAPEADDVVALVVVVDWAAAKPAAARMIALVYCIVMVVEVY